MEWAIQMSLYYYAIERTVLYSMKGPKIENWKRGRILNYNFSNCWNAHEEIPNNSLKLQYLNSLLFEIPHKKQWIRQQSECLADTHVWYGVRFIDLYAILVNFYNLRMILVESHQSVHTIRESRDCWTFKKHPFRALLSNSRRLRDSKVSMLCLHDTV